jgi:hypothetical protein
MDAASDVVSPGRPHTEEENQDLSNNGTDLFLKVNISINFE